MKSTKHWHAMNGSIGCLPDNNEIHSSKSSAIDSLVSLFDGIRSLRVDLSRYGAHYFADPGSAGAAVAEVHVCHDAECLEEYPE